MLSRWKALLEESIEVAPVDRSLLRPESDDPQFGELEDLIKARQLLETPPSIDSALVGFLRGS